MAEPIISRNMNVDELKNSVNKYLERHDRLALPSRDSIPEFVRRLLGDELYIYYAENYEWGQELYIKKRDIMNNPNKFKPFYANQPISDSETMIIEEGTSPKNISFPNNLRRLIVRPFNNEITWTHLANIPASVEEMFLGHDGIINGSTEEVINIIRQLPNLRRVEYCDYYTSADYDRIRKQYNSIRFIPIK